METVEQKAFVAARDGMAITLYALLCEKPEDEQNKILSFSTEEDCQKTTPFIIAARNGHEKVVKLLLSNFAVNIEQTGTVKFDGFVIEGATALWCSSGAGHFDVVRFLLDSGASVNHTTLSNSTPLRAACFDGRLDIVEHLVERGADIHIPNKYNNTCLMIASYKGHEGVVRFLLEQGANVNAKAHCGATALHFACERGHLKIVELLMKFGAEMDANDQGMTPIQMAAECSEAEVVEFLIFKANCSELQQIEALELLGASYANDKDKYDIDKCYAYLLLAMQQRYMDPDNVFTKKILPPVVAYENRRESQTLQELKSMKDNHNALHLEALIIRERILGENNVEIPHPIIFRGAVFADTAQFDRCTSLWMRALMLRQRNKRPIAKDLLRFAQVFSQMQHIGVEISVNLALEVFEFMLTELERDFTRLEDVKDGTKEEKDAVVDLHELNIHTGLFLLALLSEIKCSKTENFNLCKQIYHFNKFPLALSSKHTKAGYTPLHMVCDENTHVDDFHVNDVVQFPNSALCKLLVQCGANVNAADGKGNLPLHVIVRYNRPISDFLTLHNIIMSLIEGGSHLDQTNEDGETATDASTTGVAEIIIRSRWEISLKCLAARAVRRHRLQYKGQVPMVLEEFVAQH